MMKQNVCRQNKSEYQCWFEKSFEALCIAAKFTCAALEVELLQGMVYDSTEWKN